MTASKSTKLKPSKPYPEYPLFAHVNGQWCRKINGQHCFFGCWDDPKAALAKHNAEYASLKEGLALPDEHVGWRVGEVINEFLTTQDERVGQGEIQKITFDGLQSIGKLIVKHIPKNRMCESLKPADFQKLRNAMVKQYTPAVCRVNMTRVRQIFKWAFDQRLIEKPVFYGAGFKSPTKAMVRKVRNQKPKKLFDNEQVQLLIKNSSPALRAMILLAANTGMNNADLGNMQFKHLDLKTGWLDYPRHKTHVQRRAPLWSETVDAIRDFIDMRKTPLTAYKDFVFITCAGQNWGHSSLPSEFRKLKDKINSLAISSAADEIPIPHGSFGYFRHMFETFGGNSRDQVAVDAIMGHVPHGMAGEYREMIEDDRLIAVVNTVHKCLFDSTDGGHYDTRRV